jgi:hypothetical protein
MIPPEHQVWLACPDCGREYLDVDGPDCGDDCDGCDELFCRTSLARHRSGLLCPACIAECEGDDRDEATL